MERVSVKSSVDYFCSEQMHYVPIRLRLLGVPFINSKHPVCPDTVDKQWKTNKFFEVLHFQ